MNPDENAAQSNYERLEDRLNAELTLRKKELSLIQQQIERVERDAKAAEELRTYVRVAFLLLYAHWEGFVKLAAKEYVRFVEREATKQKRGYDELHEYLLSYLVIARLENQQPGKKEKMPKAIKDLSEALTRIGNLDEERLKGIMTLIGITEVMFETRDREKAENQKRHVKELKDIRNEIAHGGDHAKSQTERYSNDFREIRDTIFVLMDRWQRIIFDYADQQRYLK